MRISEGRKHTCVQVMPNAPSHKQKKIYKMSYFCKLLKPNDMKNNIVLILIGTLIVVGTFLALPITSSAQSAGSLDLSFDSDGIVTTNISGCFSHGKSIALQSDGKIVVAGGCNGTNTHFSLARYNTNGLLDSTFNMDGLVSTVILGVYYNDHAKAVAIQNDGKL